MSVFRYCKILNPKHVFSHSRLCHKILSISEVIQNKNTDNVSITVKGWVKSIRIHKKNVFLDVSDGLGPSKLQIFLPKQKMPLNLSWGSSVEVSGSLGSTPRGETELVAENIKVHGACNVADGYPFVPGQVHPPEYLRHYLHFRPRASSHLSLLRVRDAAVKAVYNCFDSLGFVNVHVPILTSNDCEGAGEMFRVEPDSESTVKNLIKKDKKREEAYFDTKAFLSVSGQLHLEAAVHGLSKVFSFGPIFRAENSKSRLHLSEFYMIEAELAFVDDLNVIIDLIEELIKKVTEKVMLKCQLDIDNVKEYSCDLDWLQKPFQRIRYEEALHLLGEPDERALNKEDELKLVDILEAPVFVTHWPKHLKPFYMRSCPEDPEKVAAVDLLVPIVGEVAGGSLRENDYEVLKSKIPPGLDWYLELRKFGSTPTGGFGLGFERYLQFICGILNIKDTIPFPRWPHNCSL